MPNYPKPSDFAVAIACFALVLLLSIPPAYHAFNAIIFKKKKNTASHQPYEDDDGTATEESETAYSDIIPRGLILLLSSLGVLVSAFFLAGSYLGILCFLTGDKSSCQSRHDAIWIEQCFVLQSWFLILLQSCTLFATRQSVKRFQLGFFGAASSAVLAVSLPVEATQWRYRSHLFSASDLHSTLLLIEFALALALAVVFLLLPRRPDVYHNGKLVDRQNTVSALNRVTFQWASPILAMTTRNKMLNYDDLPEISHDNRAQTLRQVYDKVPGKRAFWKMLFLAHRNLFLTQWALSVFQSIMNFLPLVILYSVLRALEARDHGEDNRFQLWLLVFAMGAADAFFAWIENVLWFISYIKLGNRITEQIASVVFCKAVRKKDVKGVSKTNAEAEAKKLDDPNDAASGSQSNDAVNSDEAVDLDEPVEDGVAKTKQSTINLIGVDGKRVADFSVYNFFLLGSVIKLCMAIVILIGLIGWIPVLAGFGAFAVIAPLNYLVAKWYSAEQDNLMKYRDQKMAIVTEALQGIRQIKFSALEKDWHDRIIRTRSKELNSQWRVFIFDGVLIALWVSSPIFLTGIALTVYALINKTLSPSVAFTTISVFESIEASMSALPEVFTNMFDALVSCRRIDEYLDSPDRVNDLKDGKSIEFNDATVAWPSDEKAGDRDQEQFRLRNLNLQFPAGELSVISGRTGSGKSLLLASIIGEADVVEGSVIVPRCSLPAEQFQKANKNNWIVDDAIAYVAQIPWIENATIKANILFGLPLDRERYDKVLHASALQKDFEMLEDGDLTDIGANGINLSGGQKWRVSFARALYSRAGILVLDDIFSAVDAHVGRHLFEEALTGELGRGRTRILVTHHVALCLPKTTYSILLDDGAVAQAGMTDELRRNGLLKDILAFDVEVQEKPELDQESAVDDDGALQKVLSRRSAGARRESALSTRDEILTRLNSTISNAPPEREQPKVFTEEEKREVGAIKLAMYKTYIQASGGFSYWALIVFSFLIWSGCTLARSWWISVWTRASSNRPEMMLALTRQPAHHFHRVKQEFAQIEMDSSLKYYIGIYLGISLVHIFLGVLKFFFVYIASIKASKELFENLTYAVLRAPLRFLDTTPVGRILNRFTSDFNNVDSRLCYDIMFTLLNVVSSLAVVAAGAFVSPIMLIMAAVLFAACYYFASRYLAGAREIKRLESNAKSPIFEQFGSVLHGIGTIRAFGKVEEYITRMEQRINTHCRAYYHLWLFNRWMSLRVAIVGSVFLTSMGVLIVCIPKIDASLAGFTLSFSLQLSECIIWTLRQYANLELDMNAVERIVEFSEMPIEDQSGHPAPAAWPTKGELEVNELVVSYAPDLAPVLRGLNFRVKQNERVGVVGRTGAGKSSLTLALFRFLEARSGSVWIDGLDISKIKLEDLRSRLAIIPQDPVLFSGSVRSNLDPFNQHSDSELRDALARVQLIPSASAMASGTATPDHEGSSSTSSTLAQSSGNVNVFTSLSSKISEGGLNLSQGQRQLLCLARAIVSRPKILVLDEATSSVDMETDALIQRSIREEFADSTLIVIAHRISTIADFDRILVLGEGKVIEYDEPEVLMTQEKSAFRDMVESSGERRELETLIQQRRKS